MKKSYKCNKCGRIIQVVGNSNQEIMKFLLSDMMCDNKNKAPFPPMCDGQMIPFNIKPAPCKDCD